MKFIVFIITLLFINSSSANFQYYSIPGDKTNIVVCMDKAHKLYDGIIDEIRIKNIRQTFYLQIKINRLSDVDNLVLCDLQTGKIIISKVECNNK